MNKVTRLGFGLAMVTLMISGVVAPAQASDYAVSSSATNLLARAGASVTLTIDGLPSGEGIYVRECLAPASVGTRPTTCASIADTVWTSLDSSSQNQGAQAFSGAVVLPAKMSFTSGSQVAVDCEVSSCGILVRRDHLDPTDLSLDRFFPITFAAPYSVAVSKTAEIAAAGETVSVSVAGLSADQGVYVRLCKESSVVGERPSLCDGQGVWASLSTAMQAVGAVNAAVAINVQARAKFGTGVNAVDCSTSTCGIFVRRDHLDPTDVSLDRFTPVSFAPAIIAPVVRSIGFLHTKGALTITIRGYSGSVLTVKNGAHSKRITPRSDNFSFKQSLPKGHSQKVQVIFGKKVLVSKTFKG